MQESMEAAVAEWARRIPVDQIPRLLAFLSARLLAEGGSGRSCEHSGETARDAKNLLTAGELAERLGVPDCSGSNCDCLWQLDYRPLGLRGPRRRVRFKTRKQAERFQTETAHRAA